MKEIYGKIGFYSFVSGTVLLIAAVLFWLIFANGFEKNGDVLASMLVAGVCSLGSGWFFKEAGSKLPATKVLAGNGNEFELKEIIFQPLPSFHVRTALMSETGEKIYEIAPAAHQPIRKWLTASPLFMQGLFFPVTYEITSPEGIRVASFTFKNEWKRMLILLWGQENELIGHFEMPALKNLLKRKAELYNGEGFLWRTLEAKNTAGDMDVLDEDGRLTASYRFGIFPYALHPAFQAIANHEYVNLAKHISDNEKRAYAAVYFYWLIR